MEITEHRCLGYLEHRHLGSVDRHRLDPLNAHHLGSLEHHRWKCMRLAYASGGGPLATLVADDGATPGDPAIPGDDNRDGIIT